MEFKNEIECTHVSLLILLKNMIYLSPRLIQTRKYASNHGLRPVVAATQLCDAVCECTFSFRETFNYYTNYAFEKRTPQRLIHIVGKIKIFFCFCKLKERRQIKYEYPFIFV